MSELKEVIRKYSLQNAVKFEGKANPGAVIGKIIQEDPDVKKDMKNVSARVNEVIREINQIPVEMQLEELKETAPELLEEKKPEEKEPLKELKDAEQGKVKLRFAPSPSGPLHLGHAYPLLLNSEYARKYGGELILRIEDTNPENIYEPAYGLIPEDAKWLTKDNISEVIVQTDRLGLYYDHAEKLIEMGKAYICECEPDHFKQLLFEKKACPCRELSIEEQHKRYAKMFGEYDAGDAVMRIKTDIKHKNPAMRDFSLMRINEYAHPRLAHGKYKTCPRTDKGEHAEKDIIQPRVWPLMNLAVFVDDVVLGITHVIRAKDHIDNAKRQEYLYDYFDKKPPETVFVGKINFSDMKLSSSETKKLILEGKYEDWSDIRLAFMPALKRRGYQPEAFTKYALDVGVTQNDKTVSREEFFKSLNHFNKEVLEEISNRYFFTEDPQKIIIKAAPPLDVCLDLHPDHEERGKREFHTKKEFYIAKEDLDAVKDKELVRLMGCLNFEKDGESFAFVSEDYNEYKTRGKKIIHWLPADADLVKAEIVMPDKTVKKGLCEPKVSELKEGSIIQFERVGFCRLDEKKDDNLVFWFAHR